MDKHSLLTRFFSFLRSFFVVIIAVLFTLNMIAGVAIHALAETVTSPKKIVAVIQNTHFAARSRSLLAYAVVTNGMSVERRSDQFNSYSPQVWEKIGGNIFPIDWVEHNEINFLMVMLTWITGNQTELPELFIDLSQPVSKLQSSTGVESILPLLQNSPSCPPEVTSISIKSDWTLSCLPVNSDITQVAYSMSGAIASSLPSYVTFDILRTAGILSPDLEQSLRKTQYGYQLFSGLELLILRLSILLFLMYAILVSTSISNAIRNIAKLFLYSAAFTLFLILIVFIFISASSSLIVTLPFPGMPLETQALLIDVAITLINEIGRQMALYAFILLIAGILLLLSYWLIQRSRRKDQSEVPISNRARTVVRRQFR